MSSDTPNWIPQEKWDHIRKLVPIATVNAIITWNPIITNAKVLLVHRVNSPAKNEWWIPGGRIQYGESLLKALIRKVKEETGLSVDTAKLANISASVWPEVHAIDITFLVTVKNGPIKLNDESDNWGWFKPNTKTLHPQLRRILKAMDHQVMFYKQDDERFSVEIG